MNRAMHAVPQQNQLALKFTKCETHCSFCLLQGIKLLGEIIMISGFGLGPVQMNSPILSTVSVC